MIKKLKVGIIGCGAMGSQIAFACRKNLSDAVDLIAICDKDRDKMYALNCSLTKRVRALSIDDLVKKCDLVIEASSASISAEIVRRCIAHKTDCLVMSVGGLLGKDRLLKSACARGVKIYIPSGAVAGIDALKAAAIGTIRSVTLTTRKPPQGLVGAPYLVSKSIDVTSLKKETVVFEGSALDAVKAFPANINVSAVLSFAGIGARKTRVRIIASPGSTKNIHDLEIIGDAGRITTRTENVPSKANPKTSALAIYSAIATLEQIARERRIGT